MKIQITRRVVDKLMDTYEQRDLSGRIGLMLVNYINENTVTPSSVEDLRKDANTLLNILKSSYEGRLDEEKAMLAVMLQIITEHYYKDQHEMAFMLSHMVDSGAVFHVEEFSRNPYFSNIKFENQRKGDFELCYEYYQPYELFVYGTPARADGLIVDIPKVGWFTEMFKYPSISEGNNIWMSITPNEVYTMEKPIKNAKGRVLTLGCGMGYYAYMVSLKNEVESVTIVEREQDVIDLFEEFILPQFENKDKVKIVKADAIEYLSNTEDGSFDHCFADIWISVADIAPYFAVKEVGRKFRKTKMEYWIEDSFASLLAGYVFIEIMRAFTEADNHPLPDDIPMGEEQLRVEDYVHRLLENETINKPEHIDYYMNPKNIIALIDRTNIIF